MEPGGHLDGCGGGFALNGNVLSHFSVYPVMVGSQRRKGLNGFGY